MTQTLTFFLERLIQFPLCFGTSVACSFARFWFSSSDFNIRRYWTETNYFLPVLSCVGIPIIFFLNWKRNFVVDAVVCLLIRNPSKNCETNGKWWADFRPKLHISHILANLEQCPASSPTWSTNSFPTTTISTSTTSTTTSTSMTTNPLTESDS